MQIYELDDHQDPDFEPAKYKTGRACIRTI